MNSQSKGYSIILYLIWPFSALLIGLKNFHTKFGRNLIIALYAFLGFTAISIGDLERYEEDYYLQQGNTVAKIFTELISLQNGKFYNSFISVVCGFIFESHHFYFLILFLIYGYFYINTVNLLTDNTFGKLDKLGLLFFFGILLFLLIRPLPNIAFYTGGIFVVYNMVSYYKFKKKKHLYFILFAPLIHIGLTIYLILPVLLLLFKNKIWYYIVFLIFSFAVGKSNFVETLDSLAKSNRDTIIESKFVGYASEEGQARLEELYAKNEAGKNIRARILKGLQEIIMFVVVPIGVFIIFVNRKKLILENTMILFQMVLLFWSVSNLMVNISQGERFVVLFSFISIGLFFKVHLSTIELPRKTIFNYFLKIFIPALFLFGLMTAYASNILFSVQFFISNFFIELFFTDSIN